MIKKIKKITNPETTGVLRSIKKSLDFSDFQESESICLNSGSSQPSVITIVNYKNNKRITISNEILSFLNNPERVQVSFSNKAIALAEKLPDNKNSYIVKRSESKGILITSTLVDEITEKFALDFTEKTSITFHKVKHSVFDDCPLIIAFVPQAASNNSKK